MKLVKKAHIFKPNGSFEWSKLYAQVPTPYEFNEFIRIYYTTRPEPKEGLFISYTSFIDIDKDNPEKIIKIYDKPILDLGLPGCFDEHGIMPGSLIKNNKLLLLFYTGWSRCKSVPYHTSIGLAISEDNGNTFTKPFLGPILGKNAYDPFLVNGPYVIKSHGYYHMWYSSCYNWIKDQEHFDPIYKIKHATSKDLINWIPDSHFCITEKYESEAQNAPCIIELNDVYYMFFCYRKAKDFRNSQNGYKLGYAKSKDLKQWIRSDIGIDMVKDNWDFEMQAYPRCIKINNRVLIFFNGNYFGKDGFGFAELEYS